MHPRFLIAALATAVVTGTAASVSLYSRLPSRGLQAVGRPVETILRDGRLYLTAEQRRQTRNQDLWPVEMKSLLSVERPLHYGEWVWNDRGVPLGKLTMRVDLVRQLISVARGGHEIGTAVILYGATSHETPLGRFPVLSKAADYRSLTYDASMPYALRLTADGVAIHGSDVRAGSATHGCIGLPLEFARRLFGEVGKGDTVLILRSA